MNLVKKAAKKIDEYNYKSQWNQVLNILEPNPFFRFRHKKTRAIPLKTSPYLVSFEVHKNGSIVYVYSVFHTAQNPTQNPK
ncbi:putative truncated plasmid stabilization system protein [Flavobacterium branchiophilum]|uniref:Probable truncated plasmid stabilization system protein n=1 Tax=Flavobacterium branchiophilum (strain FL-15) TaxID=1034807 RepID=G2Z425_FLABF|nr:hypothetical protein [Flavobacterium branchiophilum]CCB68364.1 Probable truncated plasmid stabilization system protein [Flavobacterium branchiophilum FL-15]